MSIIGYSEFTQLAARSQIAYPEIVSWSARNDDIHTKRFMGSDMVGAGGQLMPELFTDCQIVFTEANDPVAILRIRCRAQVKPATITGIAGNGEKGITQESGGQGNELTAIKNQGSVTVKGIEAQVKIGILQTGFQAFKQSV